jgi:glycine/D-amino acid oxidase-like deaminating enzyme
VRDQRIDQSESAWVAESAPAAPRAPLAGLARADVAVLGGGLTGVSAAWHLRERHPELGIALVEARVLGNGASGRNGGQVLNWINGVDPATPEQARRVYEATLAGIDLAEDFARRFGPANCFRRQGCLEVYTHPARAERGAVRAEWLRSIGIPAEFIPASALGIRAASGALRDPRAGRINAYALLQAMRSALVSAGISVYESTPVSRVRLGAEISLETPRGELRARSLVLATGAYSPALGFFRNGLLPIHSHVIATAALPPDAIESSGWGSWDGFSDDMDRIAYACRTPAGRIVFGGGGNAAYSYRLGGAPVASTAALARAERFMGERLARYFPALASAPIAHRWSGPLDLSFDRVCSIGVGLAGARVFHALGYSGHGLALALLAGRVIADLYDDHPEPWRELPFFQKPLPWIPPEPLRWLGYQAVTRATGRSPRKR